MSFLNPQNSRSWLEIANDLHGTSRPTFDFYVLCVCAASIGSFGLLMNNTAPIIGAVMIAPLMGPILGLSFSMLSGRRNSALQAAFMLLTGCLLIMLVSYVIGLNFQSLGITNEIAARARPNLLNLLIALPAGFMAGYARVRKALGDKLYGVVMSVAVLPPLAAAGLALAQNNVPIALESLLMFASNIISIILSSFLAFVLADVRRLQGKHLQKLALPILMMLILCVPLTASFFEISETTRVENNIHKMLMEPGTVFSRMKVTDINTDIFERPLDVEITLQTATEDLIPQSASEIKPAQAIEINRQAIQDRLRVIQIRAHQDLGKPVVVHVHLIPMQSFNQ